jgi:hypothetical protein
MFSQIPVSTAPLVAPATSNTSSRREKGEPDREYDRQTLLRIS